jgi:hypothetical protein
MSDTRVVDENVDATKVRLTSLTIRLTSAATDTSARIAIVLRPIRVISAQTAVAASARSR